MGLAFFRMRRQRAAERAAAREAEEAELAEGEGEENPDISPDAQTEGDGDSTEEADAGSQEQDEDPDISPDASQDPETAESESDEDAPTEQGEGTSDTASEAEAEEAQPTEAPYDPTTVPVRDLSGSLAGLDDPVVIGLLREADPRTTADEHYEARLAELAEGEGETDDG